MLNFIKKHSYLNFDLGTVLILFMAIFVFSFAWGLPEKFGYENGLIENIQLIVLFVGFYLSCTAKEYKKFFIFVALVISTLLLREINCGRTLFFAVEEKENTFYKWKELKYGYLAHPIFGFYIVMILFYFIKNKLLLDVFQIIKKFCVPLLSVIGVFLFTVLGIYSESQIHNLVIEEFAELFIYIIFVQLVWMYSRQKIKLLS